MLLAALTQSRLALLPVFKWEHRRWAFPQSLRDKKRVSKGSITVLPSQVTSATQLIGNFSPHFSFIPRDGASRMLSVFIWLFNFAQVLWEHLNYFLPLRPTLQSASTILPPVAVETIFGDINVLSIWVLFKSDACFILWRHLFTSKIPALVTAPTRYIHNSEISVSEFRGHDAFGRVAMCATPDSPELTYIWHDEHSFVEPSHVITTICCFGNSSYLVTFSTWRTPLRSPFKLQILFFSFFLYTGVKKKRYLQNMVGKCHLLEVASCVLNLVVLAGDQVHLWNSEKKKEKCTVF